MKCDMDRCEVPRRVAKSDKHSYGVKDDVMTGICVFKGANGNRKNEHVCERSVALAS